MFGSKNNFFKQDIKNLKLARTMLKKYLRIKGRKFSYIKEHIEAYDYFTENPEDYDGATIVKDLVDIRVGDNYLDLEAMLHDYEYKMGANRSMSSKVKADWKYFKNMSVNGKGTRVPRLCILILITPIFVAYKRLLNKK